MNSPVVLITGALTAIGWAGERHDLRAHAYVSSSDPTRARRMADRIVAGRVFINGVYDEPDAPFGGFKESGLGREFGAFGWRRTSSLGPWWAEGVEQSKHLRTR